jgi:glycosyltransferase involved in cell wall biosynthesis
MNISICITTFNEAGSIAELLDSLLEQTLKADEIIIVDGGSIDATAKIIRNYQKKFKKIKLIQAKCTRAEGRNLSVKASKNELIAITDGGCVAHKNWLQEITKPLLENKADISAGFYKMVGKNPMQNAMSVFLGVVPYKFKENFLPSTRSMAFSKKAWEKAGGFPESRENSAEDTDFNYTAVKLGLNYARVKSAIVEWGMPVSLQAFYFKIKEYAKWDAYRKIWWHPTQGLSSHNIKVIVVYLRYLAGVVLLIYSFYNPYAFPILFFLILAYLFWAFWKVKKAFKGYKAALYGPLLQIVCDLAVMAGFVSGILEK